MSDAAGKSHEQTLSAAGCERAVFRLRDEHPELSSHRVLDRRQKAVLVLALLAALLWAWVDFIGLFIVLNAAAMLYYLVLCAYKFCLIDLSLTSHREVHVSDDELSALPDGELPVYKIGRASCRERV